MKLLYSLLFLLVLQVSFSQTPAADDTLKFLERAPSPDKKRLRLINYSAIAGYGLGMAWLYSQWYKDYPSSAFHFFNDNGEWEQMDKFGHFWDAYNIAKPMMRCYQWAGKDDNEAMLYGMGFTFLFQTTVEVFDGLSSEWGFSGGDMLANLGGLAFLAGQQLAWKEQRMVLKYSFHQTDYSKYNPSLLGEAFEENLLKDYNGQTYWLTINPQSFLKIDGFPRWFSLALGYGAEGMTGGKENPSTIDGVEIPPFDRYKQFYLSIDFDLARIKTKSQFLSSVFKLINIVHLPAPAIELCPGRKPVYHGLYF